MPWFFELALTPALVAQAMRTRARLPRLPEAAGDRAGRCGEGPRLRLLTVGDYSAAGVGMGVCSGVGVGEQRLTRAGQFVPLLARQAAAQVEWLLIAQSGLTTAQMLAWLQAAERLPHAVIARLALQAGQHVAPVDAPGNLNTAQDGRSAGPDAL